MVRSDDAAVNEPVGTRKRSWPRLALAALALAVGGCVAVLISLRHEPALLAGQAVPADAERAAARLLTKASALHAAAGRPGQWDAVFTADEVNGWLATDLPKNHSRLLPAGLSAPRVHFGSQRLAAGAWLQRGPFAAFGWVDLDVRLRGVNQLVLLPRDARLGLLPVPQGMVLGRIARGLTAAGLVSELRRLDGELVLLVSIPSPTGSPATRMRLEFLGLAPGELLLSGSTGNGSGN